jgi:hypothetical protein
MSQDNAINHKPYLYSRMSDMLLLGGISLVILPLSAFLLQPVQNYYEATLIITLALSHFINYPHFAQSYLIFYEGFGKKLTSSELPLSLRARYLAYGLFVPIIMGCYFLYFWINPSAHLLVFSIYAMAFFVGWHYVKQGYGMIILDSVLKKAFFTSVEKKILLVNSYVCWISSYALINTMPKNTNMFGLNYDRPLLPYPEAVQNVAIFAVLVLLMPTFVVLAKKIVHLGWNAPLSGIVAYIISLYVWLFVAQMNPLFLLIIPALHSLQYLTVVSKYTINKEKEKGSDTLSHHFFSFKISAPTLRLIKFYFLSIVVGSTGFWALSYIFLPSYQAPTGLEGVDVFIIISTVFINIHHYFLDNVMWRKENNSVKKYLFQS